MKQTLNETLEKREKAERDKRNGQLFISFCINLNFKLFMFIQNSLCVSVQNNPINEIILNSRALTIVW